MTSKSTIPQNQDKSFLEADLLSNLRLAAEFARLAEAHAEIFDDRGMIYCAERHLDHARAVSQILTKLKKIGGAE